MNFNEKTPIFHKKKQKTNENSSPNINLNSKKSLNSTFEITINKNEKKTNNFFKINDEERFSLLKINKIKNKKFSPYKTTSRIKNYQKIDNSNSTNKIYYNLLKKKKINSLQKNFISEVEFYDEISNKKKILKFFAIAKSELMKIGKIFNKLCSMMMILIPIMKKFKMERICV